MKKTRVNVDNSGIATAQQAQANAAQAIADANAAALVLKKNTSADLSTNNIANVVAGGSADQVAATGDFLRKRKQPTSGLSSALGINL